MDDSTDSKTRKRTAHGCAMAFDHGAARGQRPELRGVLRGGRHRQERVLAVAAAFGGRGRGRRRQRRAGVRRAVRRRRGGVGRGARARRRRAAGAPSAVLIPAAERRIWLCVAATDMRRSFDGLAALARNHLGGDPAGGDWFVYVNRRRTIVKVLSFDGGGYWVWAKRLEAGRFADPLVRGGRKRSLDRTSLLALLEGVDMVVKGRPIRKPDCRFAAWSERPVAPKTTYVLVWPLTAHQIQHRLAPRRRSRCSAVCRTVSRPDPPRRTRGSGAPGASPGDAQTGRRAASDCRRRRLSATSRSPPLDPTPACSTVAPVAHPHSLHAARCGNITELEKEDITALG